MSRFKNILLIMPPFSMRERYGRGIEKIGSSLPPLGLLYLGAELENKGYGVKIFDTQVCDWDIKKVEKPEIVESVLDDTERGDRGFGSSGL